MAGIVALAFAYVMSQFYRSFLAVLTPVLSDELGMTNEQLSTALAAWFILFGLSQFIVGPLLDRLGPRLTGSVILLIGGAGGAALFAIAQSPWMIIVAMGLIGIGCSPVLMASFYLFRKLYAPARFAVLSSTFIAFGNAGNLLGASPIAYLAEIYGWRGVMWGLCVITALIAVAVLFIVRDPAREEVEEGAPRGSYLELLKLKPLWFIIPITTFSYAVIANMRGLWAGPYFRDIHSMTSTEIGNITFFVAIAMVIGSLLYGPLDTLINSRKKVVLTGNAITVVALIIWSMNVTATVPTVTILLVVMGVAGMSYGVIMAHALAFVPSHMTGRGSTLLNAFNIGGTGLMQYISGWVNESAAQNGDVAGYSAVLWLYLGITLTGLAFYAFSRDVKPNGAD